MKNITLKSLTLTNFKGIRNISIDFNGHTDISGDNGTGKTTLMDAFIWLLFGKDSTDRKDFEIKTLDADNRAIAKIEHEVSAIMEIDGTPISLKRVLREKWQKKRGSEDSEFTGHETLFFCDDVPYQAGQYKSKIDSIIDESVFKMLTNASYFNTKINWTERRFILTKIAGNISDNDIAITRPDFKKLLEMLNKKSLEDYKKEICAKKKKIKDELELIPARIDEKNREIPQNEPDYSAINSDIVKIQKQISNIDDQISDKLKVSDQQLKVNQDRQKEFFALNSKLSKIEFDTKEKVLDVTRKRTSEINKINSSIAEKETEIERIKTRIENNQETIKDHEDEKIKLREKWYVKNDTKLVFDDESKFICPSCKRPFEADDIKAKKEEMTGNFNQSKLAELEKISNDGKFITNEIENLNKQIKDHGIVLFQAEEYIKKLRFELETYPNSGTETIPDFSKNKEHQDTLTKIKELENQAPVVAVDTSELKTKKSELNSQLDNLKSQLTIRETITKVKARIQELGDETKSLSQQLANLEKDEFIIEDFNRTKMNMVESRVNSMFKYVKFKMFDTLINGGSEETCICLINGVPYPDANNAARINAGLDIINTLSDFFGYSCPIFVDNSESINTLIPVNSQVIRLLVTKDKQLIIS